MTEPLVSVIIPTYNESETLEVAMRSIMDQTYQNLEIIVADDNSTDGTRELVERLAAEDNRIRYLKAPHDDPYRTDWRGTNIGVGWLARNYAMQESRGEWITFQDADDASLLNRVEVQYRLATEYNATLITDLCLKFDERHLGRRLDFDRYLHDHPDCMIRPEVTTKAARRAKGFFMRSSLHRFVPFFIKRRVPLLRRLFLGTQEGYPGADNHMFFRRKVIEKVRFRPRHERVWPAASGRGVGRDFVFQVAETFRNSWTFRAPLYLWRVRGTLPGTEGFESYLI